MEKDESNWPLFSFNYRLTTRDLIGKLHTYRIYAPSFRKARDQFNNEIPLKFVVNYNTITPY